MNWWTLAAYIAGCWSGVIVASVAMAAKTPDHPATPPDTITGTYENPGTWGEHQ